MVINDITLTLISIISFSLLHRILKVVTLGVKIQEAIFVDGIYVYGLDPQGQLLQVESFDPANNSFDTLWKQGFEVSLKSSAGTQDSLCYVHE
jgi:hypothetical protein